MFNFKKIIDNVKKTLSVENRLATKRLKYRRNKSF